MIHGVRHETDISIPTILFGAFDRHNFGDLLFPHITAALLEGENLLYAGLAERDLRSHGGHRVRAVAQLAAELGERPTNIIHVGGELLTCDAWQAAVMLLPPDDAQSIIARLENRPEERLEWAHRELGIPALAPYILSRRLFPHAARVIYNAVGGVDLNVCDPALQAEVVANIKAADDVSVRDKVTLTRLVAEGIVSRLTPDPAVMVAELFGTQIHNRARECEISRILAAFPQGYIAVQFSADFGDDATLQEIAHQLDQVAISTGYGVVFFRAGAAAWHDDLSCYQRVAAFMHSQLITISTSLNLWDICALISHSRLYCGSSLHGRIVAMAFALPRINLIQPGKAEQLSKQATFAATWEDGCTPSTIEVHEIAQGISLAFSVDPRQLQQTAGELVAHFRKGFDAIRSALK